MKILNFGSCNLDYVYTLDHIVAPGETESTDSFDLFPGGKGLNQSIAAAKAGAKVYHAGCLGRDGEPLREIMTQGGVDLSYLRNVDLPNGHAVIQVSRKGENSIFLFAGSNNAVTEAQVDAVLENFSEGDFLLLQNEINLVPYLVKKGHEKGMQIVLNPSPFNEKIAEIDFSCLSYLILNEVEAREISEGSDPDECLGILGKRYPSLKVVLTLGTRGCRYRDGNESLYHPAFRVSAVDTTAAGDTFTGYFLAALADGLSPSEGLRRASAASALAVSRMGAAPSIPYKEEVLAALPDLKPLREHTDPMEEKRKLILDYLESNLKDASLEGLADRLGYSPAYTGNYVKTCCSLPFSKLLQKVRCSVAAKLLAETSESVEEIIYRVGYQNESFFRKVFRERYGVTPLAYRKKMRGDLS
ncbi:MAG: helix-turn-helix domain-containing protein [Clostridia bacterium]|nr:helix-turn-helix domain-containing protein [Clostridia bacterium]